LLELGGVAVATGGFLVDDESLEAAGACFGICCLYDIAAGYGLTCAMLVGVSDLLER
jgi:hypothetical protein